jgi:Folate-dependent phosphoribosylglycinamide formyltransferase PurN
MKRMRVGVLASGGGSNLQALLDHLRALGDRRAADVVLVASDRADAGALERGRRAGVRVETLASPRHPEGAPLEALLDPALIDLVVLAGYLRLVPARSRAASPAGCSTCTPRHCHSSAGRGCTASERTAP